MPVPDRVVRSGVPSVRALAFLAMAIGLAGCGSAGSAIPFTDTNGRSCNYSSTVAPFLTCDVDPATLVTCTSGAPGYVLDGPVHSGEPHHLCAGCRLGDGITIDYSTCANIECSQDSDCPFSNYRCGAGLCLLR